MAEEKRYGFSDPEGEPLNVIDFFRAAAHEFDKRVHAVRPDQWEEDSVLPGWKVRDLLNHIVNENRWVPPLLEGKTIDDVGDRFDGDLLGSDPIGAWESSKDEAIASMRRLDSVEKPVQISSGEVSAEAYLEQVAIDHTIHAWDLAASVGANDRLDPAVVEEAYNRLTPQVEAWRAGGAFGAEVRVPDGADRQSQLLGISGRPPRR